MIGLSEAKTILINLITSEFSLRQYFVSPSSSYLSFNFCIIIILRGIAGTTLYMNN